jgi:hypothetical protein
MAGPDDPATLEVVEEEEARAASRLSDGTPTS